MNQIVHEQFPTTSSNHIRNRSVSVDYTHEQVNWRLKYLRALKLPSAKPKIENENQTRLGHHSNSEQLIII